MRPSVNHSRHDDFEDWQQVQTQEALLTFTLLALALMAVAALVVAVFQWVA